MSDRSDRLDPMNEQEPEYQYIPEGRGSDAKQKVPNKGEIFFPEKHPADPLKDEATKQMSHRGGLASQRTEHY